MLTEFLEFLYGETPGWIYSPIKQNSGEWNQHFFYWPTQKPALLAHIEKGKENGNVHIAPSIFRTKKALLENVKSSRTLWVDFDGNFNWNFKGLPQPNVIVQSSLGNRVHCYWQLEKPIPANEIEDLNRRLAYYLQADTSGWDANQVLRPPETLNWKHDPPLPVITKKFDLEKFSSLESFYSLPEIEQHTVGLKDFELLDASDVLKELTLPPELYNQVTKEVVVSPHRSSFMMKVAWSLAEHNLNLEQIVSLLLLVDDRIGKFVKRTDRMQRILTMASQAINKVKAEGNTNQPAAAVLLNPLDIIDLEDQLEWILRGWLHTRGFMIISGAPGIGKTQLGLDMMHSLVEGTKFLGKDVPSVGKVLFLSLEMQPVELQYIFKHQWVDFKESETVTKWADNFHTYAPLTGFDEAELEAIVIQYEPKVILIDSLSEMFQDDMKEGPARQLLKFLDRLRYTYNIAIVLIHHNRKASDTNKKPNKLSDLYGTFMFGKSVDTVITLWEEKNELELIDLKTRYGQKGLKKIKRSANLTFTLREGGDDADNKPGGTDAIPSLINFM